MMTIHPVYVNDVVSEKLYLGAIWLENGAGHAMTTILQNSRIAIGLLLAAISSNSSRDHPRVSKPPVKTR